MLSFEIRVDTSFHRSLTDVIPSIPQSVAQPDMHGSGFVNSVPDFECNSGRESVIHAANNAVFEMMSVE